MARMNDEDLEHRMRQCVEQRFSRGAPRAPSLARMAEFITARFPGYRTSLGEGYASTDRRLTGTRLRRAGKGRSGTLLEVFDASGQRVLHHNAAETYRCNVEVAEWILRSLPGRRPARPHRRKE